MELWKSTYLQIFLVGLIVEFVEVKGGELGKTTLPNTNDLISSLQGRKLQECWD